ncbi:hypothetical protein N5D52_08715 [Pseudomonas sp. GD03860]|uniref:DUF7693 family protein n=1 Tax=Pseudomonas TaxID=286 RepID=UPI002364A6BE|nr:MULTISPECIES: hypothetical protein [Pseudomonas]MDD2058785.1 hypothetical protein [Pseudomonas putida]MDH0637018.1 hypothetical protein [Pseudomonas sp. GD03860]
MPVLTPREVYQQLRDAALGVRPLQPLPPRLAGGQVRVDIEGWQLLLDFEGQRLHHCEHCRHPDGREGSLDTWQRYGTDPVSLLSTWELAQIERLLLGTPQR